MGVEQLLSVLPLPEIEADWLARLEFGLNGDKLDISFLEPPAGQKVPYVDPVKALFALLQVQGMPADEAEEMAQDEFALLRPKLTITERPRLYQACEVKSTPECIPVGKLLSHIKERALLAEDLLNFMEQTLEVTLQSRVYRMPDDGEDFRRLDEMPDLPPPKAMIEFFVGLQSDIAFEIQPLGPAEGEILPKAMIEWRNSMMPVAEKLEQALGEKVYHFRDLEDELDDDCCHRFLALHCWCSLLPESAFVQFLLEVTGLPDIDTLKSALVDPSSYSHPFTFNYAFVGIETALCRFRYLQSGTKPRIGIAFRTEAARVRAGELALSKIGAEIFFLAPMSLANDEWSKEVTRYGQLYGIFSNFDEPITFMAQVDELYVITDEERPGKGFDLKVGPELENLMWQAHQLKFPFLLDSPLGWGLSNPETCLEKSGVPERVAEITKRKRQYTDSLKKLIVWPEYCSSGLWTVEMKNISLEFIDLSFSLIKRIAAWQRNYDDTLIPLLPETADDMWWEQHKEEEVLIIQAISDELRGRVEVREMNSSPCDQ